MAKTYTVHEVVYHDEHNQYGGAFGDGSFIARFRKLPAAEKFASARAYYGKPATVTTSTDVPKRLIDRWRFAG